MKWWPSITKDKLSSLLYDTITRYRQRIRRWPSTALLPTLTTTTTNLIDRTFSTPLSSRFRSLQPLFLYRFNTWRPLSIVKAKQMESNMIEQINTNHEVLVQRLKLLEQLVVEQKQILAQQQQQQQQKPTGSVVDPPTDAEIEAERQRLLAENQQLRSQVDSLIRLMTQIEISVKGKDEVAPLELLPRYQTNKINDEQTSNNLSTVAQQQNSDTTTTTDSSTTKVELEKKGKASKEVKNNKENQAPKKEGKKQQNAGKAASSKTTTTAETATIDASRLDLRVGRIIEVAKHPDADTLYVEKIDCGESAPRTVVSGLVRFIPIDEMQNRLVVVLCNLKPAKMRGITSEAMVMCASTPEKVEILTPPDGSVPGDRVTFAEYPGTPDVQLNPKKKIWEQIAPDLATNDELAATYKGDPFVVQDKGVVRAQTLKGVQVK